jgi:GNAT superfamily N-acetyltransferase
MFSTRRALPDDAVAIYDVHMSAIAKICASEYSNDEIAGWTAGKTSAGYLAPIAVNDFFVSTLETRVVGFSEFNPESHEIQAVYVHPDYLRRGIGLMLLRRAEEAARSRTVSSVHLHATLNAVSFYQSSGYSFERFTTLPMRGGTLLRCAFMQKTLTDPVG